MCMTTWLSHQSFGNTEVSMPTFDNNLCIYMISQIDYTMALYSDSTLDRETKFCFLLFHETRFPLTKTQYPEVDLLSPLDPA